MKQFNGIELRLEPCGIISEMPAHLTVSWSFHTLCYADCIQVTLAHCSSEHHVQSISPCAAGPQWPGHDPAVVARCQGLARLSACSSVQDALNRAGTAPLEQNSCIAVFQSLGLLNRGPVLSWGELREAGGWARGG